jgi:predicted PurR-regulated permease PerM
MAHPLLLAGPGQKESGFMAIEPRREPTHPSPLAPVAPTPDDELPRPNLERLKDAVRTPFGGNLALTGLFVLAAFYTLYFARDFLLPIVLALLFNLLLSPFVRLLRRIHVPTALGAAVVILGALGAFFWGVYELSGPAYDWMTRAPQSLRKVEGRLRELKRPVQTIGKATEQVEKIAQVAPAGPPAPTVAVSTPSLGVRLLSRATDLGASTAITVILLFFLLASGDLFLRKLIKVLPRLEDKKRAVEIARQVETDVSAYLATVAMINLGLGLAVALAMWLLGLPNPLLWGVMVALTNFIPYLGALTCYVVFALLGFLTFPDIAHALAPVGAFLLLNVLEAYLVTPMILGRRLTLNPVVVFLSLTFWSWLWGIPGAILAVPITVVGKIFCDHIAPLAPLGEFLGD